jgi:hypothetical protein
MCSMYKGRRLLTIQIGNFKKKNLDLYKFGPDKIMSFINHHVLKKKRLLMFSNCELR